MDNPLETLQIMMNIAIARFDFVRFTFVDFHGITRSKTVPKARMKQFFQEGCSFFAGAIGFSLVGPMVPRHISDIANTNSGNILARPAPGTLHPLPLNGGPLKMGEILCETYFADGSIQESNPRTLARRQLEKLKTLGYEIFSSWELEAVVLDEKTLEPKFNRSIMAFTNSAFDDVEELILQSERVFSEMGIDLETLQSEASPGQYEFVTKPIRGIRQADNLILMKDAFRKLAKKYRKMAVFMTKIMPENGYSSALHFNHSLLENNGHKVFSDSSDRLRLSQNCRKWLSGLLRHGPALTALCCPTVNCYRRLHTGIAPDRANWGLDARLAFCRVKNYSSAGAYIEARLPSGSANPYLVMAAIVAAGIDGLQNSYPLPEPIGDCELYSNNHIEQPSGLNYTHTTFDRSVIEPESKKIKIGDAEENCDAISELNNSGAATENDKEIGNNFMDVVNSNGQTSLKENSMENSLGENEVGGQKRKLEETDMNECLEIPHTLEGALKALEADEYMVKALGEHFVKWFCEVKRNEIAHFAQFKDLSDVELLQKEKDCYMDII